MAKYLVTSGSKFEPMSYDDLVKPLMQATEAHKETQAAYDELAANAESIGQMIGTGPGSDNARAMYENYMTSLNSYVDDLYKNGYDISAMRGLSSMRAQYGKNITGIANALERRRKVSEALWEMGQKDRSLLTEFDPSAMGLDNWLSNPEYTGPKTQSGIYLQQLTEESAKNFKNMIDRQIKEGKLGNGQYWGFDIYQGATPQQIAAAKEAFINGSGPSEDIVVNGLVDIMRGVYNDSGVADWGNPQADAMAKDYIARGINAAMGQSDLRIQQDLGVRYGGSGGSGGTKKGAGDTVPSYMRNFEWLYGDEQYNGMSRAAVVDLENDLADLQRLKEMAIAGENFEYTPQMQEELNAQLKAYDDVQRYFESGKPSVNAKNEKQRAIALAYNKAIESYPELRNAHTVRAISPGRGAVGVVGLANMLGGEKVMLNDNLSLADERRRLVDSPQEKYKRLFEKYSGGNPNATLDDLYANAYQQSSERAMVSRPAVFNDTESTDIQRGIQHYLNSVDDNTAAGLVRNHITGKNVTAAEVSAVREALKDKTARVGVDPYSGRALIIGSDKKNRPYYYTFSAEMFSDSNYNGYNRRDAYNIERALSSGYYGNYPQEVIDDFTKTFGADINGGTVGAQTAMKKIAEWNQKYIRNKEYQNLSNYILNYVMGSIHTAASNRFRGDQGNAKEYAY